MRSTSRPMDSMARVVAGAYGCDLFGDGGDAVELGAAVEGFDGVGTGEDEPVVGADGGEGGVEGSEGVGWG